MEEQKKCSVPVPPEKPQQKLAPGERVFAYILLVLGLCCVYLSWDLWNKVDTAKKMTSAAAVPMIVSVLWVVLTVFVILSERKMASGTSGTLLERIKTTVSYIFPVDFVVMFLATIAYCIALYLGLGFYIATPLYLYATICYLQKKDPVKNILWTAIIMAMIYLLFDVLFGVVVP
ncbi:MAG: tripartite tricarboxylate transporter TctB family protein [Clostridia bacterium]|nr:tripartite tricarboxylate transporter TctB family protein [Clostridia bacterium]